MRVVIEIVKGKQTGQRRLLTTGNNIVVGRSEFADLSCSSDSQMSREHFRITAQDDACIIEDLKSRNGTLVNEIPIDKPVKLADGDRISSGDTGFRVLLQGGRTVDFVATQSGLKSSGLRPPEFNPSASAVLVKALKGRLSGTYGVQKCHSGLYQYSGSVEQLAASDIAELLSRKFEVYLMLDRGRSGVELQKSETEPELLFDFLPPESAAAISPVLIAGAEYTEWAGVIADAWGSDSVVVLYTAAEKSKVLETLRSAVKADKNGGVVGLCWPGVLDSLLTFDTSGVASRVVNLAEMILVEAPDLPERWHIYSKDDIRSTLNRFGLREGEPSKVPEDASASNSGKEK